MHRDDIGKWRDRDWCDDGALHRCIGWKRNARLMALSVVVPIFIGKGDVLSCSSYGGVFKANRAYNED